MFSLFILLHIFFEICICLSVLDTIKSIGYQSLKAHVGSTDLDTQQEKLNGRYLHKDEKEFIALASAEIDAFLDRSRHNCILLFPPVLPHYRFILHQLVAQYKNLSCKSLGKDPLRCPLIYHEMSTQQETSGRLDSTEQTTAKNTDQVICPDESSTSDSIVRGTVDLISDTSSNVPCDPPTELNKSKKTKQPSKHGNKVKNKCIIKEVKSESDIGRPPTSPNHSPSCQVSDASGDLSNNHKSTQNGSNGKKRPDKQLYVPPPAKNSDFRSSPSPSGSHGATNQVHDASPLSSHSPAPSAHTEGSRPESTNSNKTSTKVLKEQAGKSTDSNEIDDSWDTMYNEDGMCLNSELEERIKEVLDLKSSANDEPLEVSRPQNCASFEQFKTQDYHLEPDEYSHILEAYDFVPDLKTQDLFQSLTSCNSKDFDIKWVDETHALVIFSGTASAQHALNGCYGNLRLRPLHLGIRESRLKAKKSSELMLPYKQRPETSAALARRLVSGALGIRVQITPEQRAAEKEKIQKAKEERRQARQKEATQHNDMWEGKV